MGKRISFRMVGWWMAGAVTFCISSPAHPIEYTFEKVLDAAGQFSHIYGPSLNDSGAMAFTAFLPDGSYQAYGLTSTGALVPISDPAGGWVGVQAVSINNDDIIAFHQGAFIHRSFAFGAPVPYQQTDADPGGIQGFQEPWIGDSGDVVYIASLRPPPEPYGETALFRGEELIVAGASGTTTFQWPHINGQNHIVAVGSGGIHLDGDVVYQASGSSATINDGGTIAFFSFTYGTVGIYTGDGVSAPVLYAAATGGTSMGHPDINNDGLIAYMDRLGGAAETVFVGPGHERLLGTTTMLFGSSVSSTAFFRGLNNHGQIAFAYQLVDGQRGIALASPRDPAVLGNGTFDNGRNLFEDITGASEGFAFVTNVGGDPRLQMTTDVDVFGLRQSMDTSSGAPYRLEFDFDWLTAVGSLTVVVNDVVVLAVGADGSVDSPVGPPSVQPAGDLTRVGLTLSPAPVAVPADGYIRFDLHPGSVATIQMDNISFVPVLATPVPDPAVAILRLEPNHPNPFNPSTAIAYVVPEAGPVRLQIFDLRGRLARTLVDGPMASGPQEARWDGRDVEGRELPSGVYLSRLRACGQVVAGQMTLVR